MQIFNSATIIHNIKIIFNQFVLNHEKSNPTPILQNSTIYDIILHKIYIVTYKGQLYDISKNSSHVRSRFFGCFFPHKIE